MRSVRVLLAMTLLTFGTEHSCAADLSKVNRTIAKEPAYASKQPLYCLLVFGPTANVKMWVVLDGADLYVDLDGDGDLTESNERFTNIDGKTLAPFNVPGTDRCVMRRLQIDRDPEFGVILEALVEIKGRFRQASTPVQKVPEAIRQRRLPMLGRSPGSAPICHFDGPLSFRLTNDQELVAGSEPTELHAYLGTFDSAHGCFVAVRTNWREKVGERIVDKLFPTDVEPIVHPVAEIEFPAKDKTATPIRKRFELSQRC